MISSSTRLGSLDLGMKSRPVTRLERIEGNDPKIYELAISRLCDYVSTDYSGAMCTYHGV
jgi:hypothetical protein